MIGISIRWRKIMTALHRKVFRRLSYLTSPHIPLRAYRRFVHRDALGFFYHVISDESLPHIYHIYPHKTVSEFEADLRYLQREYSLVGYNDLLDHYRGLKPLPVNAAFLSFDDGFAECFHVVRPILLKHGIPCMFFLTTGFIDNRKLFASSKLSLIREAFAQASARAREHLLRKLGQTFGRNFTDQADFQRWLAPFRKTDDSILDETCRILGIDLRAFLRERQPFLTRPQIQTMLDDGFTIGAHTISHPKLKLIPEEQQRAEIVGSCRIVHDMTGRDSVPFAFPFSGDGVDRAFLDDLRREHSFIGLMFDTKKLKPDRPFIFHRIWVDKPISDVPPENNLSHWLHDAYQRNLQEYYT